MAEQNNQNTTPKAASPQGQKDEQPKPKVQSAPEQPDPAKVETDKVRDEQLQDAANSDNAKEADKAKALLRESENQNATEDGEYRFLAGRGAHSHDGKALKPGDVVTLTARQAAAFKDKFERV